MKGNKIVAVRSAPSYTVHVHLPYLQFLIFPHSAYKITTTPALCMLYTPHTPHSIHPPHNHFSTLYTLFHILHAPHLLVWEVEEVVGVVHKEHLQSSSGHVVPSSHHLTKLAERNLEVSTIPWKSCDNHVSPCLYRL